MSCPGCKLPFAHWLLEKYTQLPTTLNGLMEGERDTKSCFKVAVIHFGLCPALTSPYLVDTVKIQPFFPSLGCSKSYLHQIRYCLLINFQQSSTSQDLNYCFNIWKQPCKSSKASVCNWKLLYLKFSGSLLLQSTLCRMRNMVEWFYHVNWQDLFSCHWPIAAEYGSVLKSFGRHAVYQINDYTSIKAHIAAHLTEKQ